jgi:hypothetical protein
MKNTKLIIPVVVVTLMFVASCQRELLERNIAATGNNTPAISVQPTISAISANKSSPSATCNPAAYAVILESRTLVNGNWEWIWSVQNTNPGNGRNGTVQDLSNWGMPLGFCVNWASVVGAAYSADGDNWTSFTPEYAVNPSQGCLTVPVVKFDFGTTGMAKSYYRLVVDQYYDISDVLGYYKSGSNTSCCTFSFMGIGCGGPEEVVE